MNQYITSLFERYPVLECNSEELMLAYNILVNCYVDEGKVLVAGNGGSAADADHIVGELMKGFLLPRKLDPDLGSKLRKIDEERGDELFQKLQYGLPAIALSNHNSLNTAFLNDVDGKLCYAQQIIGYGIKKDVFWGISTSGNSENILYAAVTAKAKGMKVIGLTGMSGGKLSRYADAVIRVRETQTYKIQELHIPIYHCLCLMLEERFFGEEKIG